MKKKLEADLISIAHRILKLKNRSELDQLLQETRNLYEKLSVLRFVEDNFSEVKPTIGYASAEAKLEEVYGIKEEPAEEAQDKKTDDLNEDNKPETFENKDSNPEKTDEVKQDDENKEGEGVKTDAGEGAPASEEEKKYTEEETDEDVKEGDKDSEESESEQKSVNEEKKDEVTEDLHPEDNEDAKQQSGDEKQPEPEKEVKNKEDEMPTDENPEDDKVEEPEAKPEGNANPDQKVEEYQASEEEKQHTEDKEDEEKDKNEDEKDDIPAQQPQVEEEPKEQEQPKVEEPPKQQARPQFNFDFDSRDESSKREEITFENYSKSYKEPEFVKKSDIAAPVNVQREWLPKEPEVVQKQEEKVQNMWGSTQQQPVQQSQPQVNDIPSLRNGETISKVIALGLNDRIAFEKNLFNGSGEDLNRVISQLNTVDRFADAKNFINDLVKPDYNNWKDKEEYEERFMALVEQRFK